MGHHLAKALAKSHGECAPEQSAGGGGRSRVRTSALLRLGSAHQSVNKARGRNMSRPWPRSSSSSSKRSISTLSSALPGAFLLEKTHKGNWKLRGELSEKLIVRRTLVWLQHFAALVPVDGAKLGVDSEWSGVSSFTRLGVESLWVGSLSCPGGIEPARLYSAASVAQVAVE
jgi:hypothetical protein